MSLGDRGLSDCTARLCVPVVVCRSLGNIVFGRRGMTSFAEEGRGPVRVDDLFDGTAGPGGILSRVRNIGTFAAMVVSCLPSDGAAASLLSQKRCSSLMSCLTNSASISSPSSGWGVLDRKLGSKVLDLHGEHGELFFASEPVKRWRQALSKSRVIAYAAAAFVVILQTRSMMHI